MNEIMSKQNVGTQTSLPKVYLHVPKQESSLGMKTGESFLGIPDSHLVNIASVVHLEGDFPNTPLSVKKTGGFIHSTHNKM